MNQDVFTLPEGEVVIHWPTRLSQASFDDFKDWLHLMERKVGRAVYEPDSVDADPGIS